jgi:outer membrane protein OmpA-like peptidoglycan-associated protein
VVDLLEAKDREKKMVTVDAGEMAKSIDATGRVALYGIYFDFNKADVKPESDSTLEQIAGLLKKNPSLKLLVVGHTDNVGNENYNYDLGKRRADAVSRYLITKKNLDPIRVVPVSYGQSAPMEENKTPQGRAMNRRVEILVYRDGVTSTAATPAAQPPAPSASQQNGTSDSRISQR